MNQILGEVVRYSREIMILFQSFNGRNSYLLVDANNIA